MRKIARKSGKREFHVFWLFTPLFGRFKRPGLKRSIVWYKKLLISCLVARYSTFFVFESMEIHWNPWKSTRSTLQNLICYRMSVSRASGTPCGSVFGRFFVFQDLELEAKWPPDVIYMAARCMELWKYVLVWKLFLSARSFVWSEVFGMLNKSAMQHIYSRM